MKIEIELTARKLEIVSRRYLDPQAHIEHCVATMYHAAMQDQGCKSDAKGLYSDADIAKVLALPTVAQTEAKRKVDQDVLAVEAQGRQIAEKLKAEQVELTKAAQYKADVQAAAIKLATEMQLVKTQSASIT